MNRIKKDGKKTVNISGFRQDRERQNCSKLYEMSIVCNESPSRLSTLNADVFTICPEITTKAPSNSDELPKVRNKIEANVQTLQTLQQQSQNCSCHMLGKYSFCNLKIKVATGLANPLTAICVQPRKKVPLQLLIILPHYGRRKHLSPNERAAALSTCAVSAGAIFN